MAVTGIFTNAKGESLEFSESTGIRITSWGGLTSNSTDLDEVTSINQVGTSITGSSIQSKPHTIEGRYKYDKERRNALLSIILPGTKGTLRYIDTRAGLDVYWDVYVKNSPEISNDYYYQNFQIVLQAGFPYPRDTDRPSLDFSPMQAGFSFPRTYVTGQQFAIATRLFRPLASVVNRGPIATGFTLTLEATADGVAGPYVINIDTQEQISFRNLTMQLGDVLVISTFVNDQYCKLKRNGEEINVFGLTTFESNFFLLEPGVSNIRYGATVNEQSLNAVIEYYTIRAGV